MIVVALKIGPSVQTAINVTKTSTSICQQHAKNPLRIIMITEE